MTEKNGILEYWNSGMMATGGASRHPLFHHSTIPSFHSSRGSALILTVVLTSLLAIVGVLFLMATRIDRMASSASVDGRELTFAVDSVVARISEELARDVPRVTRPPDGPAPEYHDYPDANDPWLADLEPYRVPGPNATTADIGQYFWRQISDVTGELRRLDPNNVFVENVPVKPSGRTVIEEYPRSDLVSHGQMADADGDGIADSRWIEWSGLTSSKGRPIYAAVRIVDNGGMLNVNTAYRFDPTAAAAKDTDVDGHTQLQVNLAALGANPNSLAAAADPNRYEKEVIWRYGLPGGGYVPFDIADELELRYRYCIDSEKIGTRVENMWAAAVGSSNPKVPYDASSGHGLLDWCLRIPGAVGGGGPDRRHLLTTYNMDRIRTPKPVSIAAGVDPNRMVNVNTAGERGIPQAVAAALPGNLPGIPDAAQIVVNLLDYIDDDCQVTVLAGATTTSSYYGFEQPCIYISELACRMTLDTATNRVHRSYAVELFKPYFEDPAPGPNSLAGEWRITIDNQAGTDVTETIAWSGTNRFHVLLAEDGGAPLQSEYVQFSDPEDPAMNSQASTQSLNAAGFSEGATIELQRKVTVALRDEWLTVDRKVVPTGWMMQDGAARSLQRDISAGKCIFRLWRPVSEVSVPSLGNATGSFISTDVRKIQAHPANRPLRNIGELGMVFAWSAYGISEQSSQTAENILIDLRDPIYAGLLNYLTVIDPAAHGASANETRIKGRININTAPVFVLAQLPWMQYGDKTLFQKASAVVDYRSARGSYDRIGGPFKSAAGLLQIAEMLQPGSDGSDNQFAGTRGPDVTPDPVLDDMEERDLIFTRISDLVTVRSDVFTAYILVRIGADGPQKRVVAILDRSQVRSSADPVRIIALQQVPDPR